MEKMGVSSVLATVLIILITIAAVTIVWQVVIPLITRNLEGSDSCLNAVSEVFVNDIYTVYNETHVRVSVDLKDSSKIETIMVRITDEKGNAFTDKIDKSNLPSSGGRKSYTYILEEEYAGFGEVDKVGVAAIVLKGNKEEICNYHEINPLNEEDLEI